MDLIQEKDFFIKNFFKHTAIKFVFLEMKLNQILKNKITLKTFVADLISENKSSTIVTLFNLTGVFIPVHAQVSKEQFSIEINHNQYSAHNNRPGIFDSDDIQTHCLLPCPNQGIILRPTTSKF